MIEFNNHQTEGDNNVILELNLITRTTLISDYCKREALEEALSLYKEVVVNGNFPDVVTCSSIINSLCKHGKLAEAKLLLKEMEKKGMDPNRVSYATLLDSFFKEGNSMDAFALKSLMAVHGIAFNVVVYTILMDTLLKVGKHKEAENMFVTLLKHKLMPNSTTIRGKQYSMLNAFVNCLRKSGRMGEAEGLIKDMMSRGLSLDQVKYTSLMDGFFKEGKESAALILVQETIEKNIPFDVVAYNILINGLLRLGKYEAQYYLCWSERGGLAPGLITCNTMINAYCKEGKFQYALNLCDDMKSWGVNVKFHNFHVKKSFATYSQMLRKGVPPNIVTYNLLLTGLASTMCLSVGGSAKIGEMAQAKELLKENAIERSIA
ncbi:hypothetical protein REPUB_Repub16aG0074000 [Reevesia pubescens]